MHCQRATDCVVIGAGPGGLGTAALLQRQGLEVVVLERSQVAATWRAAYDRLRINTSSWFSYLPGQRFPRCHGRWPCRDQLVGYYEDYARRHDLQIEAGVRAEKVTRAGARWEVATTAGTFAASVVVVATGKQNTPVVPEWPGRQGFSGRLIHAAGYRNAEPFRGRRGLVVGAGNSAMDIALELADVAAGPVTLSVRRPPHILRREVLGMPHDVLGVSARRAPRRLVDLNAKLVRRLTVGDLSEYGLPRPNDGTVARLELDGRVPIVDAGEFTAAIRAGRIRVGGPVTRFERDRVFLAGGEAVQPDVVVAATGYRPDLDGLVGHLGVLDESGSPLVHGGETSPAAPRLHFVGCRDPRSGALRELRLQARAVAEAVASQGGGGAPARTGPS